MVENSIKYGFRTDRALEINISVSIVRREIIFKISDNGNGIEEGRLKYIQGCLEADELIEIPNNLGLMNVNSRIRMRYGMRYGLHISSALDKGTEVTIRIPDIL